MCRTQPFRENGNFTTSKEYSHSQLSPALLSPPHVLYFSDFWLVYWSFESVCEKILWCILVFVQTYATTIFVCVHLPKAVSSWTIIIVFRSLTKKSCFSVWTQIDENEYTLPPASCQIWGENHFHLVSEQTFLRFGHFVLRNPEILLVSLSLISARVWQSKLSKRLDRCNHLLITLVFPENFRLYFFCPSNYYLP